MTTASSLVSAESFPTSATDVWAPVCLPLPEASARVSVTTAYVTAVARADDGAETRRSLLNKPKRTVQFGTLQLDLASNRLMQIYLERLARARGLAPLWSDAAIITSAISPTDTVPCSTAYRRFVVGGRVAVLPYEAAQGASEDFELRIIDTVNASSLVLDSALGNSYAVGDIVVPMIEVQPAFSGAFVWTTARYGTGQVEVDEVNGPTAIDASAAGDAYPAGLDTYSSLPIWPWYANRGGGTEVEIESQGSLEAVGQGFVPQIDNSLPRQRYGLNLGFWQRSDWWQFLQFFDAARGRLGSFWMLSPGADLELLAINSATEIVVSSVGPLNDWTDRRWVGLLLNDGSQLVAEIDSVSRNLGQDTITLVDGVGSTVAADVLRCCLARRVRFAEDSVTEEWTNRDVVDVSVGLIELHEEATVAIGYSSLILGPVGSAVGDGCGVVASPQPPDEGTLSMWLDASDDSAWLFTANGGINTRLHGKNKAPDSLAFGAAVAPQDNASGPLFTRESETLNGLKVLTAPTPSSFGTYFNQQSNAFGVNYPSISDERTRVYGSSGAGNITIYCLSAFRSPSASTGIIRMNTGDDNSYIGYSGTQQRAKLYISLFGGGSLSPPYDTGFVIHHGVFSPPSYTAYFNDYQIGTKSDSRFVGGPWGVGSTTAGFNAGDTLASWSMAELLVYLERIEYGSAKDLEIRAYLTSKWGL